MAAQVLKFVLKSAVAGSLVYVTLRVANGPWIAPYHLARYTEGKGYIPASFSTNQEQPSPAIFKEAWNKGVMKVFHGIHKSPGALTELSNKTLTYIKESYKNTGKNDKEK